MIGQINLGTSAGDFIYNVCLREENKTIVEIGTWNGMGSTRCVMQALLDKDFSEDGFLLSLESNKKMFDEAVQNWNKKTLGLSSIFLDKLKLVHGRIIEKNELILLEEIRTYKDYVPDWETWYQQDLNAIESCENVLHLVPAKIDVLVLDGGEFSTLAEFNKLKDRSRVIVCDDTKTVKCRKIRQMLLNDSSYKVILDIQNERNGFSAFERIK